MDDVLSGVTKLEDAVASLYAGEPLRDIIWEEQERRVLMRTVRVRSRPATSHRR